MEPLEALKARIPGYVGYTDESGRHLVDQQIRAWVGERLALLDGRLGLSTSGSADAYDDQLRACEFGDPHMMRALEVRAFDEAALQRLYAADLALVEAAERAETVEPGSAAAYLQDVKDLFARRTAIISTDPEPQTAGS